MPEMSGSASAFCTSVPYRLLARRVVLPWALQGLRPRGEVLEIGAGSGAMAVGLLDRFPEVRVVATDYDPAMVDVAARALQPFGARGGAERADASELPFASGRFSVVLSCAMLHHVVNWEQALTEVVRVLAPGGSFVGFDLLHVLNLHRAPLGHDHAHHAESELPPDRIALNIEPGAKRLVDPDSLRAELVALAITDLSVRRSRGGLAYRFLATRAG